jgi:thiol-disulfide isomerase/thioredoxin
MFTKVYCSDPSQFNATLEKLQSQPDSSLFILFTGTKNPSTGTSWCSDCVRADPIIDSAMEELLTPTTLLVCDVDREPYKTDKDYIYRVDPRIYLRCVPTLMKWENGKCSLKLNDTQCQNSDLVKELLES